VHAISSKFSGVSAQVAGEPLLRLDRPQFSDIDALRHRIECGLTAEDMLRAHPLVVKQDMLRVRRDYASHFLCVEPVVNEYPQDFARASFHGPLQRRLDVQRVIEKVRNGMPLTPDEHVLLGSVDASRLFLVGGADGDGEQERELEELRQLAEQHDTRVKRRRLAADADGSSGAAGAAASPPGALMHFVQEMRDAQARAGNRRRA
jgi:hypothetical protein